MDNKQNVKEFEILGYKVKLQGNATEFGVSAEEVVELVKSESDKIISKASHLANGEVALLVALQMAKKNLESEKSFKEDIDQMHSKASAALDLIEQVSPSS